MRFIPVSKNILFFLLAICSIMLNLSCNKDDTTEAPKIINIAAGSTAASQAQTAFIEVDSNFTIVFGEGKFLFTNTLSMDGKNKVIIKGAGRDKTILDFSGQTSGGEGVLISKSNSIRFEDITILDSKGDALKARDCNKISFVNVGTVWSGTPKQANGAYGLYPVLCSEVYIDKCYAYGASDAGIYVGQSDKIIVKSSIAEGNVAGIEIENSTNADVFDNEAFDNTGGILVFDLPGLTKYGNSTRVYNNNIHDNNRISFAPKGNIVANVPVGTGCMILSTKNVEIFNNKLVENTFAGVLVVNYLIFNSKPNDAKYDPFPSGIYIHDNANTLIGSVNRVDQPDLIKDVLTILFLYGLKQPHILIDGLLSSPNSICIKETSSTFINLNAGDTSFKSITTNSTAQTCTKTPLPEVKFIPF